MAAPIQRYTDPRLTGEFLAVPLEKSYAWIRTVTNPVHPKCSKSYEYVVRAFKALTGVIALALTTLPWLLGRSIQVISYHVMGTARRENRLEFGAELVLPRFASCDLPEAFRSHATSQTSAISILRWGFDPSKTMSGALGDAIYITATDQKMSVPGNDQLVLSLDLKKDEVISINEHDLSNWRDSNRRPLDITDKKTSAAMREVFLKNGIRAVNYRLNPEAWAIFDESCISILEVHPDAPPPLPSSLPPAKKVIE